MQKEICFLFIIYLFFLTLIRIFAPKNKTKDYNEKTIYNDAGYHYDTGSHGTNNN